MRSFAPFACAAMAFAILCLVSGCSDEPDAGQTSVKNDLHRINSIHVTRADFGKDWPLTVDGGEISCREGRFVTFTTGGKTYAVNGLAGDYAKKYGWVDMNNAPIRAIRKDYPEWYKDIGPIIDRGNQLCR